jgi:hypothetical protein
MSSVYQRLLLRALLFTASIALIAVIFSATANGQQGPLGPVEEDERSVSRVVSLTWDIVEHRFKFTIQDGECKVALVQGSCNAKDVIPGATSTFEIDPDNGVMTDGGKTQPQHFGQQEAVQLHRILDFLERYSLESRKWFREGKGLRKPNENFVRRPIGPYVGTFKKIGVIYQ